MPFNCPICDYKDTEDFIIDTRICNACSHVYKKEPFKHKNIESDQLHLFLEPLGQIRQKTDIMEPGERLMFVFPSMNFYGLDVSPTLFYKSTYNHYFNQRSIIILLNRCGLTPVYEKNVWAGTICETHLLVEKEAVE